MVIAFFFPLRDIERVKRISIVALLAFIGFRHCMKATTIRLIAFFSMIANIMQCIFLLVAMVIQFVPSEKNNKKCCVGDV